MRFEQRWQHCHVGVVERKRTSACRWHTSWICYSLGCSGQQTGKHEHNVDGTMRNVKKRLCVGSSRRSSSTKAKQQKNVMQICFSSFFLYSRSQSFVTTTMRSSASLSFLTHWKNESNWNRFRFVANNSKVLSSLRNEAIKKTCVWLDCAANTQKLSTSIWPNFSFCRR